MSLIISEIRKKSSAYLVRPISNVVLLPCRTQFINYKFIRIVIYWDLFLQLLVSVLFSATATLFD